jgi:hypothetical protein
MPILVGDVGSCGGDQRAQGLLCNRPICPDDVADAEPDGQVGSGSPSVTDTRSRTRVDEPRLRMLAQAERKAVGGRLPPGGSILSFYVEASAATTPFPTGRDEETGQRVPNLCTALKVA